MAYTTPTTRTTGTLITASIWNTDLVDNIVYLKSSINAQVQITGFKASITNGGSLASFETASGPITWDVMEFADTSGKVYGERGFVLPSDYNSGTVTAKFLWSAASSSTNSVVWGIQAYSFTDTTALNQSFGTAQEVTDAGNGNADRMLITSATSAITIGGTPTAGRWAQFRVYRDSANASDTLAATARLHGVVLEYTRT